ncbi:IclR family transcriptional regulator [Haladaptatus sp. NG-SE-30]
MVEDNQMETIGSVEKTFQIIEELIDHPESIGVTDLARRTGFTKSTVYKHLNTLEKLGYVNRVKGGYEPSVLFLDYGQHVIFQNDFGGRIRKPLDQLAEMTNETAGLVVEEDGVVVDIYCTRNENATNYPIVNTRHLHCSAPGKAILAEWPDNRVETYLETHSLPKFTPNTRTQREDLMDDISRIRKRGFAFEREEQYENVNSLAVSITAGSHTGAVFVSGKANEFSGKRLEENIPGMLFTISQSIESKF